MRIEISRENILKESMDEFKNKIDNGTKNMTIIYKDEIGYDTGGLLKDWFTVITNDIINLGIFKPVPSGYYYTIDGKNSNEDILHFTGQLIAAALNNNCNLNLKLVSFIWKILLNEKITIEDMEEYDDSVYKSLKWMLENDVEGMNEVFVDSNDVALKKNGRNIRLTNENKNEYVNLMLKRIFIGKNGQLFKLLADGFNETVDLECVKLYDAKKLREEINGQDIIDLVDWKNNTVCKNKDELDNFFNIIAKWPNKKLRKLLEFTTGSPLVPIKGFKYLNGGQFNISLCSKHKYPEAHTCINQLILPKNNYYYELRDKLLIAIEVNNFGIE